MHGQLIWNRLSLQRQLVHSSPKPLLVQSNLHSELMLLTSRRKLKDSVTLLNLSNAVAPRIETNFCHASASPAKTVQFTLMSSVLSRHY